MSKDKRGVEEGRSLARGNDVVTGSWSRRELLISGAAAGLWLASGGLMQAAAAGGRASASATVRELALLNLHTGERTRAPYWQAGRYRADALASLDAVLRDHRTGEATDMDPRLYDALHALSRRLGDRHTFHVISGYRSPKTNALLRQTGGGGVARKSYHMRGMAIDVRVPGVPLDTLHRAAKSLEAGGVGKYTKSDFIHMDVGPVRYW